MFQIIFKVARQLWHRRGLTLVIGRPVQPGQMAVAIGGAVAALAKVRIDDLQFADQGAGYSASRLSTCSQTFRQRLTSCCRLSLKIF